MPAGELERREHLCRYVTRPPIAIQRLGLAPDGRVVYGLKRHWRDGTSAISFDPLAFIERLTALVPHPRAHQITYHGVLAPASVWRDLVVPKRAPALTSNLCGPLAPNSPTAPSASAHSRSSRSTWVELLRRVKHRHRYHGVFAPNHKLRPAVTALAIGNIGKRREAVTGGHAAGLRATGGCCDANPNQKPRSHDTSRIAWAKLMARVGEEFPLECPNCGGDIRLIAFITEPGPIRKILTHLGEPLEPFPLAPARGPPTEWGELVQAHDDRAFFQASPDELPAIDIHSL